MAHTVDRVSLSTASVQANGASHNPVIRADGDPFAGLNSSPLSLNRYSCVAHNPATWSDPSGHFGPAVCLVPPATVICVEAGAAALNLIGALVATVLGVALGEAASQALEAPQSPTDNWSLAPTVKRVDLKREIEKAGWTLKPGSGRGRHDVFVKDKHPNLSLPRHREISPGVAGKIRRTLGGSGGTGSVGSGILQSAGSRVLGKELR